MARPLTADSLENATTSALEAEIRVLERRLREGEELLRHGRDTGGDLELLARWEVGWIKLLRQYEILNDRLRRHLRAQRSADQQES